LTSADSKRAEASAVSPLPGAFSEPPKAQPVGRHAQPLRDHAQLFLGRDGFAHQPFAAAWTVIGRPSKRMLNSRASRVGLSGE
jgi:hypothetical protein